jgi:hypothetical protein
VQFLALYFRAQLVVGTMQPNMNVLGLAPHRKRNAPHRFAPQRNALQCDAAQDVRPFGAILAAFVCF